MLANGTVTVVQQRGVCDVDDCGKEARYDAKTWFGMWANMCEEHYQDNGIGLGVGKGQRLLLLEEAQAEGLR